MKNLLHITLDKQIELERVVLDYLKIIKPINYDHDCSFDAIVIAKYITRYLNCLTSIDRDNLFHAIGKSLISCFKEYGNTYLDIEKLKEVESKINDHLNNLITNN